MLFAHFPSLDLSVSFAKNNAPMYPFFFLYYSCYKRNLVMIPKKWQSIYMLMHLVKFKFKHLAACQCHIVFV